MKVQRRLLMYKTNENNKAGVSIAIEERVVWVFNQLIRSSKNRENYFKLINEFYFRVLDY